MVSARVAPLAGAWIETRHLKKRGLIEVRWRMSCWRLTGWRRRSAARRQDKCQVKAQHRPVKVKVRPVPAKRPGTPNQSYQEKDLSGTAAKLTTEMPMNNQTPTDVAQALL